MKIVTLKPLAFRLITSFLLMAIGFITLRSIPQHDARLMDQVSACQKWLDSKGSHLDTLLRDPAQLNILAEVSEGGEFTVIRVPSSHQDYWLARIGSPEFFGSTTPDEDRQGLLGTPDNYMHFICGWRVKGEKKNLFIAGRRIALTGISELSVTGYPVHYERSAEYYRMKTKTGMKPYYISGDLELFSGSQNEFAVLMVRDFQNEIIGTITIEGTRNPWLVRARWIFENAPDPKHYH